MRNDHELPLEKPVLVAGASGFVGSHTVRLLLKRGRKVRALLRKTSNTEALDNLAVEMVYGDALDPDSLRRAMQGCGTVFWSVVDPRYWLTDPAPLFRTNVSGLNNAMEAALHCGIDRFVLTSTMGTLGRNPGGVVTEHTEFNWLDRAPPYILSRVQAEQSFMDYCKHRGLPGVALCIANTYGPDDFQPVPQDKMLWECAKGNVPVVWNAAQPTVDIRDAAEAILLAERNGRIGERYIVSNEFMSYREMFTTIAAAGGRRAPLVLPLPLAYAIAWVGETLLKLAGRKDFLLRKDAVFLSIAFGELDSSRARAELGWQPRPFVETVRDTIDWFAEREKVRLIGFPAAFGTRK